MCAMCIRLSIIPRPARRHDID